MQKHTAQAQIRTINTQTIYRDSAASPRRLLAALSLAVIWSQSFYCDPALAQGQTQTQTHRQTQAPGHIKLKPRAQLLHFNRTQSKIGVIKKFVVRDKSREKDLEMRVSYPLAPGNYPILVFSHGAGSSKDGYTQLTEYLANNKFICIQPTHDDSIGKLRQKNFTANIGTALATTNDQKYWINRARDMVAVLDHLDEIATKLPSGVTMDKNKIACGGHSFGAFTTLILAGAPVLIPDGISPTYKGLTDFGDERFKAFLVLCGQGTGKVGLCFPSSDSYGQIKRPMMVMTGSKDKGQRGQPPEWRMESFTYSKGDNKYLVFINGANHMSFSGNIFAPSQKADADSSPAYWRQSAAKKKAKKKAPQKRTKVLPSRYFPMCRKPVWTFSMATSTTIAMLSPACATTSWPTRAAALSSKKSIR